MTGYGNSKDKYVQLNYIGLCGLDTPHKTLIDPKTHFYTILKAKTHRFECKNPSKNPKTHRPKTFFLKNLGFCHP